MIWKPLNLMMFTALLAGCGGVEGGQPGPGDPDPGTHPRQVQPYVVKGRALNGAGQPLVGAYVEAREQVVGGQGRNFTGQTNAQGYYALDVRKAIVPLKVFGQASITFDGDTYDLDLVTQNDAAFAAQDGAVRDLKLSADSAGAAVVVQQAIGTYLDYQKIQVRLESVGPLIDGSTGKTLTTGLQQTGDGWLVRGLPIGTYKVTASYEGRPLRVSPPLPSGGTFEDYQWASSYTGKFKRSGPGIYFLRVEVCAEGNVIGNCLD